MALETANYLPELDAANPPGSDAKSQGDDHLRLTKKCVLATFGAFVGSTATPKSVTLTEDQINDAALKSASQTISGDWTFSGTNGFQAITATTYEGIAATNLLSEIAAIDTTVSNTDAAQPGYKGTPQRSISDSDSLVLTDCGKQIYLSAGASKTLTIPANASVAFPIGTIIPVINDSGNNWSIAITTDTLEPYGGTAGTQTLGDNEKAVLEKVTATLWKYSSTD